MANELSKAIKQKTDSQLRLLDQDTAPVIRQTTTGDNYAVDPNEYSQSLTAGKNITINTAGNIKTINAIMGILAGNNITVSEQDENGNVTITAEGGAIEQATETVLGGVKAKEKTTETAEIAIDTITGKLFAPASEGGGGSDLVVYSANGFVIEDFEDSLIRAEFNITNNVGWNFNATAYKGARSFSNGMNNNNSRVLSILFELLENGKISLWFRADSTRPTSLSTYYSAIYLDNLLVYSVFKTGWVYLEFELSAGLHTIRFNSFTPNSAYSMQAWIDELTIPDQGSYGMDAVKNNSNSLLKVANDGTHIGFLSESNLMQKIQGAILPTPTAELRGQIFTLEGGAGVADISYICKKNASNVYTWVEI